MTLWQSCVRYYLNDLTYRTDPPKSSTEQYNVRRRKSKGSYREEADLEAEKAEAEADIDLYNFIVPYWSLLSGEKDRVHRAYQPELQAWLLQYFQWPSLSESNPTLAYPTMYLYFIYFPAFSHFVHLFTYLFLFNTFIIRLVGFLLLKN